MLQAVSLPIIRSSKIVHAASGICRLDSFGYFPGVKFLLTDVSENSVVSIIKGANEDRG
jgi:hypothetical protein